jgi:hypothetical protein
MHSFQRCTFPCGSAPHGLEMCQGHNDLVRSNGSEHLESVYVESNGFPKQLHERSFGKPAGAGSCFRSMRKAHRVKLQSHSVMTSM